MYQASSQIDLFELHDSPVQAIAIRDGQVQLDLEFASIRKEHACNPYHKAQTIKPCSLLFQGVKDQLAQVFSETERVFKPHPDPSSPIDGDIIEFEVAEATDQLAVKLAGFHQSGWVEWRFTCSSGQVTWSEFAGSAWYES